jgi:hypothetical protein
VDVLVPLIVFVLLAVVVVIVGGPLRSRAAARQEDRDEAARAALEAEKVAKYREIRESELDFRTGKLSEADWRAIDRRLRAEAVDILRRIDELGGHPRSEPSDQP